MSTTAAIPLQCPAGVPHVSSGNVTQVIDTERRRSIRAFKSSDEYLYAVKEDLSEWLNSLYELSTTADDLLDHLATGSLLCRHAENVQRFVESSASSSPSISAADGKRRLSDATNLTGRCSKPSKVDATDNLRQELVKENNTSLSTECHQRCTVIGGSGIVSAISSAEKTCWTELLSAAARSSAQPGTFHSRDNISQFLTWCRRQLFIPDTLLFETEDLVLRKNERSVVFCLVEVARRAVRRCGFPSAPQLIRLEEEIDEELAREEAASKTTLSPYQPRRPAIHVDMMSLDEMVREILSRCTCPDIFPMVRVSDGRYRIGDSQTMIFVRILRSYVMVRIGGGWDTLQNFLDRHDPCRCQSRGHRIMSATTSFVSSPRGFDKTSMKAIQKSMSSTNSVHVSSPESSRETSSGTSPTSFVTSVQTSGAWTVNENSTTSRMTSDNGVAVKHRRMRPKTPSTDCDKQTLASKTSASITAVQTPTSTDERVTIPKMPSPFCKQPITPVAASSKSIVVGSMKADQKTNATNKILSHPRRAPTPEIGYLNKSEISTSGDAWSSSRPRGRTRTSVGETSNSESKNRGRQKSRSSSAGPQQTALKSKAEESVINGRRSSQSRRVSLQQSSLTTEDVRRSSDDRSSPHTLLVRRSVDGRHTVGDNVTKVDERTTPPIHVATVRQQNSEHHLRRQSVETLQQSRNSMTSANSRFSFTTNLLPSRMQVPQRMQSHSTGGSINGDSGHEICIVDADTSISTVVNNIADSSSHVPVRRLFSVGDTVVSLNDLASLNGCKGGLAKSKENGEIMSDEGLRTKNGLIELTGLDDIDQMQLTSAEQHQLNLDTSLSHQSIGTSEVMKIGVKSVDLESVAGCAKHVAFDANFCSKDTSTSANHSTNGDRQCIRDSAVWHEVSTTPKRSDSFQTLIDSMPDIKVQQDTEELNSHMELLFEEYRKVELGLMDLIWKANNEVETIQQPIKPDQYIEKGKTTKDRKPIACNSRGGPTKHADKKPNVSGRLPPSAGERQTKELEKPDNQRQSSGTTTRPKHSSVNCQSVGQKTPRWASSLSSLISRPGSAGRDNSLSKENTTRMKSINSATRKSAACSKTRTNGVSDKSKLAMTGSTAKLARQHQTPVATVLKVNGVLEHNQYNPGSRTDNHGNLKRSVSATLDFRVSSDDFADLEKPSSGQDCLRQTSDKDFTTFSTSSARGGQCRQRSYSRSALNDDVPPTRIPLPVDTSRYLSVLTSPKSCDERLNRADSGVDINNMT